MAVPSPGGVGTLLPLVSALAAIALLPAPLSASDPTSWVPGQCQCDADPAIVALCSKAALYPPDIAEADWESIGDQYVAILDDSSLTEQQRAARYGPLVSMTGLPAANFTWYADKYAAFSRLPSADEMRRRNNYCSVMYGSGGLTPCQCFGGGIAEMSVSIMEPVPIQFLTDEEAAKEKVVIVLREKLSDVLGLWYMNVSVRGATNGENGDSVVRVLLTTSTTNRTNIEQRFPAMQTLLGSPSTLTLADGSESIILGTSTLDLQVPMCSGPVSPPSDLPAQATVETSDDVVAGTSVRFRCPDGLKFSSGKLGVWRRCGADRQMKPAAGQPLTCVDKSVTAPTTTPATMNSRSTISLEQGATRSTTPYVPDQYEELDVDWNDGESIKKVDPNKPNLLFRITIPAASVIFVFLVLYLLCTRPESCMCNTCGGGKLDEVE